MPYCGHLQFIKHYSNQGIKTTYREGTSDNREIKATQLLLKPCGVLKNWGLDFVLCALSDEEAAE